MACGSPLTRTCEGCGASAPPQARFCMSCGAALGGDGAPAAAAAPSAIQDEERRTVTVLFADISGFTSVAEQLDHETVKALLEPCLIRLGREVERYDGRVDKYIGDAVMAVFGAPVTHEDDAERAVRAAFGMQAAMPELNRQVHQRFGVELALRVGVNTGEVLAGRVGESYTVLGDAVNVAARLQTAASVGGILVGERTRRLSAAAVVYRQLPPLELKGKAERVAAWEAVELEAERPPAQSVSAAPLIGRSEELARLVGTFERVARDRAPQLVTIIGQPGVGKSRLLNELELRLAARPEGVRVLRGRCLAFGQGVVYWPLAEMLRAECGIGEGDEPAEVRAKLADRLAGPLAAAGEDDLLERRIAPLARVLGAQSEDDESGRGSPDVDADARESFFGAVRAVLEALAMEAPLALAWEDIHWADEGTLDLIDYLSRWLRAPVLQVCLAREQLLERRPAWSAARRTATVAFLEPLTSEDAQLLVESLLSASGAVGEKARALAERSGGNPLFAEAMVAHLAEEDGGADVDLPDTVQGVLAARLDALKPFERQLVAHAAVIGRTFWESALEPVAAAAGVPLAPALAELQEKDIVLPGEGLAPAGERELAFKHVLIRDVAYEMLSKAVRARKHAEVGAFIAGRAGGGEGSVALVAEHYSRAAALAAEAHLPQEELADLRRQAAGFGEAAGDAAASMFSNSEALARYEQAAALAEPGGEAAGRIAEKSGDVSLRLGRADRAIELWQECLAAHSELGDRRRVAELHRKIGSALAHKGERKGAIEHHQQGINLVKDDPPSLTLVRLYEEAAWLYMQVGDNMLAIYASEKALRLAESLGEARAASRAHGIFGRVFGRIGDAAKAHQNLERAVELARQSDEAETVLALLALGNNLEHSDGDYEAARSRYVEALELAERIGEVPAQIELQSALAQLAFYRCDWEQVGLATEISVSLAEREGLVGKLCLPDVMRGRLCWRDGDWPASVALLSSARSAAERVGLSEVEFSALLALAATRRDQGALDQAEADLREAIALCDRAGLVPQSVHAFAGLALVEALAGRRDLALDAAERAAGASERVHEPAGAAAALQARAIVAELPDSLEGFDAARARWEQLGRPFEVARCEELRGRRLLDARDPAAATALSGAAALFERIGIGHLAARARELAAA